MKTEERPQSVVEWREMLLAPGPLCQPFGAAVYADAENPEISSQCHRVDVSRRPAQLTVSPNLPSQSPPLPQRAKLLDGGIGRVALPKSDGSRASQRMGTATSIPKSERPDLSWLDETDEPLQVEGGPPPSTPSAAQAITYAFLGLLGGAVLGGMLSIMLASILSAECFADKCIFQYLMTCSAIGAIAGVFAGLRIARQVTAAETRPPFEP
jgi:hypothetical protein